MALATALIIILSTVIFFLIRRLLQSPKDSSLDFPGKVAPSPYVYGTRRNEDKIPPVFPNGWYPLKESKDVTVGTSVYVQALGENFVIFRGENGVATVADAWCPHLGANLGVGSTVVGNCIRCPFHHWTFDGQSGECTSVPYADKAPSAAKLKLWKSTEASNCIFVWYHADNEEPTWFPKPMKEIENGEVVVKLTRIQLAFGHIQDMLENLADFAHFLYLHRPGVLSGHSAGFYESFWNRIIWASFDEITWEASEDKSTSHLAYITVKQHLTIFGAYKTNVVDLHWTQYGPGIAYASMDIPGVGKLVLETLNVPIEPLQTSVLFRVHATPGFKTTLYMPFIQKNIDVMSLRDMAMWRYKCYQEKPVLAKGEKISQYRRWFSQFYSENSPKLTKWSKLSLDW